MAPLPKFLLAAGIGLVLLALLWHFGSKVFPFGRLPGDIAVEKENFRFYFPLATCLLASAVISLALYLFNRFWK